MRRVLPLALLVISVGCGDAQPRPGVAFSVDVERFAPGDSAQLQLVNGVDQTLGYNLCFSDLQRQTGSEWQTVTDAETACTTIQHGLAPGDTAHFTKQIITDVSSGTYRFQTSVEFREDGRQEELATQTFRIEE